MVSRSLALIQTGRDRLTAGAAEWLAAERDRLPLWLPVALAAGIALWFVLPWAPWRQAAAVLLLMLAAVAALAAWRWPAGLALMALAGMAAVELRVAGNAHPVLAERRFAVVSGVVVAAEPRPFGGQRLIVEPLPEAPLPDALARLRLTLRGEAVPVVTAAPSP